MKYKLKLYENCSLWEIIMIWIWRNHPKVSKWMVNKHVGILEHFKFINSLNHNVDNYYYIVFLDNKPIGTFNFKFDNLLNECEWGYYLNPFNNSCVGSVLEYIALSEILPKCGDKYTVYCNTLNTNTSALKLHNIFSMEYDDDVLYTKHMFTLDFFKYLCNSSEIVMRLKSLVYR